MHGLPEDPRQLDFYKHLPCAESDPTRIRNTHTARLSRNGGGASSNEISVSPGFGGSAFQMRSAATSSVTPKRSSSLVIFGARG